MTKTLTPKQEDFLGAWFYAHGPWLPVHRSRQDGPGTLGQVSCSGMGSVLSYGEATKPPAPSQARFV